MPILIASSNPHKVEEILAVFRSLRSPRDPALKFLGLTDLGRTIPPPEEDQPTFEANAALKARYYAQAASMPCLADDSGLEVDALGGEPGVYSARYAGVSGPRATVDLANNQLLLQRMEQVPQEQRSARFVCAMALAGDHGRTLAAVRGTVEGRILLPQETANPQQSHLGRGKHGFGYDPLFLIKSLGRTTAELGADEKNAISHRGQATRLIWAHLISIKLPK